MPPPALPTPSQTLGGALTVGLGAGCISTLGFQYLTPFLDRTIGLGDTCGERQVDWTDVYVCSWQSVSSTTGTQLQALACPLRRAAVSGVPIIGTLASKAWDDNP